MLLSGNTPFRMIVYMSWLNTSHLTKITGRKVMRFMSCVSVWLRSLSLHVYCLRMNQVVRVILKADHVIPLLKTIQWFPSLVRISKSPYRGRRGPTGWPRPSFPLRPPPCSLTALQPHRTLDNPLNTPGTFSLQSLLLWLLCLEPTYPQFLAHLTPLSLCSLSYFLVRSSLTALLKIASQEPPTSPPAPPIPFPTLFFSMAFCHV